MLINDSYMKKNSFVYSIIIPHYNIPELLVRCLNSIPVCKDIQVIVIDDCSPGADKYKEQYPELSRPYLEFYSTSRGGSAGRARNIGLQHAKGKWLIFADSDDIFTEGFIEYLSYYADSNFDIVFFDVESRDTITLELTNDSKSSSEILHKVDFSDKQKSEDFRFNHEVPWGKMIRHDLVIKNQIRFDEVLASNDTMFMLKSLFFADRITFLDKKLYCWMIRQDSLVHATPKLAVVMSRYEVDLIRNRFCIDNGYRKYTRSVANWLLMIIRFGIKRFFKAVSLLFKYRINPFTKCSNWVGTIRGRWEL